MIPTFYGTPRLKDQQEDIFPGSPLALVAIFTSIIQERFKEYNKLPWIWVSDDPTPGDTEENTEDNPRKIYIESKFTQYPVARNFKPAILIDRLDTRFNQIVLGNRAHFEHSKQIDLHIAHVQTIISISCVSLSRGESANLAEHVAIYLLANKNPIRESFGLHDISMPVLGTTTPYRNVSNENDGFNTPINIEITAKTLWRVQPIAPTLNEIVARAQTLHETSVYNRKKT